MATGGSTLNRFYPAVANSPTLSFRCGVTHIEEAPENGSFAIRVGERIKSDIEREHSTAAVHAEIWVFQFRETGKYTVGIFLRTKSKFLRLGVE